MMGMDIRHLRCAGASESLDGRRGQSVQVSQVEEVDQEVGQDGAGQVAAPEGDVTHGQPQEQGRGGPGQEPPHGGQVGQAEGSRRDPDAQGWLHGPAEEELLTDGGEQGQPERVPAGEGAQDLEKPAVQLLVPAEAGQHGPGEQHHAQAKDSASAGAQEQAVEGGHARGEQEPGPTGQRTPDQGGQGEASVKQNGQPELTVS